MTAPVTILDAMADPQLFGPWFRDPATWAPWRAFLAALFCLEMDRGGRRIYRRCTGRARPPRAPIHEAWIVAGRRGGKSFVLALCAVFLACFRDWRSHLIPGERAVVMVIARDRKQARVILDYVRALLAGVPMLAPLVMRETAEVIDLDNGVSIEIHTCSYRSIRGRTVVAGLLDELAFWQTDDGAANPDSEILQALRPAMASVPGSVLLCASSPYARRGELYRMWREHYGKTGPVLVWQADTRTMNSTISKQVIKDAYAADPASAAAEYGANFRADIEGFVSMEAVVACVATGRRELPYDDPPDDRDRTYRAFTDPAGGSGGDSMTLAISHKDKESGRAVLDCIREVKPKFSPASVVAEFATVLKSYKINSVTGDRYASEWPRERFREHGITYWPSKMVKSDIYLNLLPLLNSNQIELLDNKRLISQLCGLERRTARSGKDSIDHAPSGHDDLINAAAGALLLAGKPVRMPRIWAVTGDSNLPPGVWLPAFGGGGLGRLR